MKNKLFGSFDSYEIDLLLRKKIHLHVVALICSMKMMWMFQCFPDCFFIDFHVFSCLCWGSILESLFDRIFDGKRHQNDLPNPSPSRPLLQKWLQNSITPNSRNIPEPNFFGHWFFNVLWHPFGSLLVPFGSLLVPLGSLLLTLALDVHAFTVSWRHV